MTHPTPSPRNTRLTARAAGAALIAAPLADAAPVVGKRLPLRTAKQNQADIESLVRRLGDLSAYLVSVDDNGTIAIRLVKPKGRQPSCGPKAPKMTLQGHAVDPERLALAQHAVTVANAALAGGPPLAFKVIAEGCLDHAIL